MPVISDLELKKRLEAHNYQVPPITEHTKKVLLKKLNQLDKEANHHGKSSKLNDYSSAEEDGSSANPSPYLRRRKITSPPTNANSTNGSGRASQRFSAPSTSNSQRKSQLLQLSDEEEGDDDEVEEEEEEEDDSSNQTSDSDDDDEDEEQEVTATNVALQTTFNSTLNSPPSPINGKSPTNGSRKGQRFVANTPSPIRSTASYLNNQTPITSTPMAFPPNSPLRKAVSKNASAFGSLGEAMASLSSTPSQTATTTESVTTQASKTNETTTDGNSLRSIHGNSSSHRPSSISVSKVIMVFTVMFFGFLTLKYWNLRPKMDIENKLLICQAENPAPDCISLEFAEKCTGVFFQLVTILEEHSARIKCSTNETSLTEPGLSLSRVVQELQETHSEWVDESINDILSHLVLIIEATPQFGIKVTREDANTFLLHENPLLDWNCWILIKLKDFAMFAKYFVLTTVTFLVISLVSYLAYRLYKWRSELLLRERQDTFELVEQVLSLLMKHHHHLSLQEGGNPRMGGSRASLPVNHIRDQLIAPHDRKRKQRIWKKVIHYIHDSESRVREDVQVIFGEEHKVWQWIPEVNWNSISHPGPNPYVAPLRVMSPPTPAVSSPPPPNMTLKSSMSSTPNPNTPSSRWQGSAFSSLNRNVAAPSYAPSSCLKIRHMFDKSIMSKNRNWVNQVSEEILQRCANAGICHIAVDRESNEGCVYVKAVSNNDAAKMFKTLHGQWYRGNLVTAKYLRDERYLEKFPDAKNHLQPMRPTDN